MQKAIIKIRCCSGAKIHALRDEIHLLEQVIKYIYCVNDEIHLHPQMIKVEQGARRCKVILFKKQGSAEQRKQYFVGLGCFISFAMTDCFTMFAMTK